MILGLGCAALTSDTGERTRRTGSATDQAAAAHLAQRLPTIRAALAAARPGFVFVAGNSHAELFGNALARRLPVVNGGIGGTSARRYAMLGDAMPFRVRAGVAVLFLGTNDILRKAAPLSDATRSGFEAAVLHILGWLQARADIVLVAAVPPLGPQAQTERDPAAVAAYTATLRNLCERTGCRFFDPYAALRDGEAGLTTRAAPPDGVHLQDDDALATELVKRLRAMGVAESGGMSECVISVTDPGSNPPADDPGYELERYR